MFLCFLIVILSGFAIFCLIVALAFVPCNFGKAVDYCVVSPVEGIWMVAYGSLWYMCYDLVFRDE